MASICLSEKSRKSWVAVVLSPFSSDRMAAPRARVQKIWSTTITTYT